MSRPSFFTRLLPPRLQPDQSSTPGRRRRYQPGPVFSNPTNSFIVHGFRAINPSTSEYHSLINQLRITEEFPFSVAPMVEISVDGDGNEARPLKKLKTDKDVKIPTLKCGFCYSDLQGPYLRPCRNCEKPLCVDCVRSHWEAALGDHERMPARCCSRILYHDVAKGILPPADLARYKVRWDESNTPNPFYCPVPSCSTFIPPRMLKTTNGNVTCHVCTATACIKCRQVASPNHLCGEVKETVEILKRFHYKLCPKCGTGIMRMWGCNHVRCRCGAHWCWDCERPLNACIRSPCMASRGEGDISQSDTDPDEVLDSDDERTLSILSAESESGPGVPIEPTQPQVQQESSVELATDAANQALPNTTPAEITTTTPAPETDSTSGTGEAEPKTEGTPKQEEIINLDDPDNPAFDWEEEIYDFGEDPYEEPWDAWGCMHKFERFTAYDLPEKWLLDLDTCKPISLECMVCFKGIQLEARREGVSKPKKSNERKKSKDAKDKEVGDSKEAADKAVGDMAEGKEKRKADKTGAAYDCVLCGVIHCWSCRKSASRQVAKHRHTDL
jgi:IBR domain, a half RING-finger domain